MCVIVSVVSEPIPSYFSNSGAPLLFHPWVFSKPVLFISRKKFLSSSLEISIPLLGSSPCGFLFIFQKRGRCGLPQPQDAYMSSFVFLLVWRRYSSLIRILCAGCLPPFIFFLNGFCFWLSHMQAPFSLIFLVIYQSDTWFCRYLVLIHHIVKVFGHYLMPGLCFLLNHVKNLMVRSLIFVVCS